jgi:hypothetical protein
MLKSRSSFLAVVSLVVTLLCVGSTAHAQNRHGGHGHGHGSHFGGYGSSFHLSIGSPFYFGGGYGFGYDNLGYGGLGYGYGYDSGFGFGGLALDPDYYVSPFYSGRYSNTPYYSPYYSSRYLYGASPSYGLGGSSYASPAQGYVPTDAYQPSYRSGYAQQEPQYGVPGYDSEFGHRPGLGVNPNTDELRPGMVLPDGSRVLSVGPLRPATTTSSEVKGSNGEMTAPSESVPDQSSQDQPTESLREEPASDEESTTPSEI